MLQRVHAQVASCACKDYDSGIVSRHLRNFNAKINGAQAHLYPPTIKRTICTTQNHSGWCRTRGQDDRALRKKRRRLCQAPAWGGAARLFSFACLRWASSRVEQLSERGSLCIRMRKDRLVRQSWWAGGSKRDRVSERPCHSRACSLVGFDTGGAGIHQGTPGRDRKNRGPG